MAVTRKAKRSAFAITIPSKSLTAIFKNNKFGTSRQGRLFTRNEYKRAIKEVAGLVCYVCNRTKIRKFKDDEPLEVDIHWFRDKNQATIEIGLTGQKDAKERRSDVDAPVSGILDALQEAGVIANDKNVVKIICSKG